MVEEKWASANHRIRKSNLEIGIYWDFRIGGQAGSR
jgi:hypothetical protein